MARYGDINRAAELQAAKDAYDLWLKKSRAEKQAAYATTTAATGNKRSNVGRSIAWIQPFGAPDKFFYQTWLPAAPSTAETAKQESASTIITKVADAAKTSGNVLVAKPAAAGQMIERSRKVPFAKVIYTKVDSTAVKSINSRITNLPYSYRKTDSVSSSFGQNATTPVSEQATRILLTTALLGATPTGNERVSFRPQGQILISLAA
jgi:hypothetical protein